MFKRKGYHNDLFSFPFFLPVLFKPLKESSKIEAEDILRFFFLLLFLQRK